MQSAATSGNDISAAVDSARAPDISVRSDLTQIAPGKTAPKQIARNKAGASASRPASLLQIAASLVWIPQAALLSLAVGQIAAGRGAGAVVAPAAGVFALGAARAALEAAGQRIAFRSARHVLSDRRDRAIAALAAGSPFDPARPLSGLAASVLAEQAEAIVPYLARFQPARLRASVVPLVILACVFAISWVAALVLLIAAPLIPIFMALVGWQAKTASERQLGAVGQLNAFLLDRLRGLATIRALGAVEATTARVRENAEDLRSRTMAVLRIAFLSSAVLELFAALGVAMVAVYVGFHLLGQLDFGAWGSKLSLNRGLFILLLAPAFFEPLRDLSAAWHDRAAGEAAIEALDRLSQDGATMLAPSNAAAPLLASTAAAPEVTMTGLRYRYPGRTQTVFSGFDVDVSAGEHVAILAPSGVGKSTLLALLAGLIVPEAGRIAIGDVVLGTETIGPIRAGMAWIGQSPHIFAGTLAGNVTLGRDNILPADVTRAVHAMQLDHIHSRGAGIGESGGGLSGGEALRLALARAAASPHINLILADEPTAHLDSATAREITDSLLALARGRTLIVATHDPVLAARMDRVIRLSLHDQEVAAC